jgi:hypothetical protein
MTAGQNNLWPRFTLPVSPNSGKITNNYRGFFSRLKRRVGPAIADVLDVSPPEDMGRALNEILAELRAQGWIDRDAADPGKYFSESIQAMTLIPAATEFGYDPREIVTDAGNPISSSSDVLITTENAYESTVETADGVFETNYTTAIKQLQDKAPNCGAISLFVSWFGDDLRAGNCQIKPKVQRQLGATEAPPGYAPNPPRGFGFDGFRIGPPVPADWRVAGIDRADADTMSTVPPSFIRPAFGGTPTDNSVIRCIQDLNARGFKVSFTPFLLMDVPNGNTLPNPYTAAPGQPVYPWRGRITCYPAPGVAGSPDKTVAAAAQIASFVGSASSSDFFTAAGPLGDEILYSGPVEWSYRRMLLHYAHLCKLAGGVDVFVVGTELRGLGWVRDAADHHPFVEALRDIAADVRAILPDAHIIYAADWSEYHSYQPPDGSGDTIFHLDPLWADANIDAIGIDCYFPLADWRDGTTHLDYLAGFTSIYDFAYLQSNIFGGEDYDWYYASDSDRNAQIRTDITDGAYDKPWVFRLKDLPNWWSSQHYNRLAGIEQPAPTGWLPQSKPIWFTEIGCPAVDKGANQPNVFVDANSSESAYPYFSSQVTDELIQRRYNHAILRFFDETDADFDETHNPRSSVYDGRMLDVARLYLYTWDARPFPQFPDLLTIWSDGVNWQFGHWLTGRIPVFPLIQSGDGVADLNVLAPDDPYLIDPATGKINKRWRDFFEGVGFIRGDAIASVPAEPSTTELAAGINAILTMLRSQRRIST